MEQRPIKEKTNIEYPTTETISIPEHTEWIKIGGNSSTVILEKEQVNVNIDRHENKYNKLVEEDEEEEEEYMQYISQAHKKEKEHKKKSVIKYDMNEMSITNMNKILIEVLILDRSSEECSKV